jgi:hypothetical protein
LIFQNRAGVVNSIVLTVGLSFSLFGTSCGVARQIDECGQAEFFHLRFKYPMLDNAGQIVDVRLFRVNRPTLRRLDG